MNQRTDATSSPLANKLMEYARADGVLAIRGLQAALIDAAIALDNYVAAARSERAPTHPDNVRVMIDSLLTVVHHDMRGAAKKDLEALVAMLTDHPICSGDLATQREIADTYAAPSAIAPLTFDHGIAVAVAVINDHADNVAAKSDTDPQVRAIVEFLRGMVGSVHTHAALAQMKALGNGKEAVRG